MIQIAKPVVEKEEEEAVLKALKSGQLATGPLVQEFEDSLAKYCEYKHAIACSSGTAALHIAMLALDIKKKDEVMGPAFTFIATANCARFVGAMPKFADIDLKTFNMSPESMQMRCNENTKAVIPVSLFGQAYDVDNVMQIAREKGIKIVSDNCQAIGTKWKGKKNFKDDMQVLSFYPTKNITTGEGGCVLTDDDALAEKLRLIINHGMKSKYEYSCLGYNLRMTSIGAAIGIEQLKKLDSFIEKRRSNAQELKKMLQGIKEIELPFEDANAFHAFNSFTIKAQKRDKLKEFLEKQGIGTAIYYPTPLSKLKMFKKRDKCQNAEEASKKVLSLPIHPSLSSEELKLIAEKTRDFYS